MRERWTPVYDRLFDPEHDLAGGPACRRWAWIDLCHMAQWKDGTRVIGGTVLNLKRGELLASIRYLGERWEWSKDKVRRFLDILNHEEINKIRTVRATPFGTVYRIVSYDVYANPKFADGTPSAPGTGTGTGHQRDTDGTKNNSVVTGNNNLPPRTHARKSPDVENSDADLGAIPGGAELAAWLGEHENGVVGRFVAADDANGGAVRSILATYASSSMTGERVWKKTPEEERKIVLADALETLAGEGEKYKANFFRRIIQDRLAEGVGGGRTVRAKRHDFGDETERDRTRASKAAQRHSQRAQEKRERAEKDAETEMAQLWGWWEEQDAETRARIESKARRKAEGLPEPLHRSILIGEIQAHRPEPANHGGPG